jgi:hypothetical protein
MLFFAVFCGFLAENQREHMVEHQREKQYMKSLLEDLQNDIADLKIDTAFWREQFKRIAFIQKEIKNPWKKEIKCFYISIQIICVGMKDSYTTIALLHNLRMAATFG